MPRLPFLQLTLDDSSGLVAHPGEFASAHARARDSPPAARKPAHSEHPDSATSGSCSATFHLTVQKRPRALSRLPGMTPLPHLVGATLCSFHDPPVVAAIPVKPGLHSSFVCWPQHPGLYRACPDALEGWRNPVLFCCRGACAAIERSAVRDLGPDTPSSIVPSEALGNTC